MVHNKRKIIAIVTSVFMALTVCMIPTGFVAADDGTEVKCTNVKVPDRVASIGYMACYSCDSLTSIL